MNKQPKPLIVLEKVSKTYETGELSVEVLKEIDLEITEGEFVSIMGPSGSGKSTLLYLIGGLDKPTSGSISIGGRLLTDMKDKEASIMRRRELGFVFQFYNLVPNLTVEDNVLLPALLDGRNIREYQDKLSSILHTVGLAHRKSHTPRELSGGEQQRVAIARAMMNNPRIILADEPTGNLDTKTGEEVMELFAKIHLERNITIVMVTHSAEAAALARRIVQVRDGRLEL